MKKTYSKPEIFYESFAACTNIAAGCERIVGNPSKDSCAIEGSGGVAVFTDTLSVCDFTPEKMGQAADQWDGFCYHVPTEKTNLFNS